jgi:hypothetical protein
MPVFRRRSEAPPKRKDHTAYRPQVREDFAQCCAYCLLPEVVARGQENFELDHFHPRAKRGIFKGDINDFYNLYYSCHVCNQNKGAHWPTEDELAAGRRFIDLCREEFDAHFEPESDGQWRPLTIAAQYAAERLRLNGSDLVQIRVFLGELVRLRGLREIDWRRPAQDQIGSAPPGDLTPSSRKEAAPT